MINNSSSLSVLAGLLAVALSKSMGSKSSLLSNIDDTITVDVTLIFVVDSSIEEHVQDMRSDWEGDSDDTEELWNDILEYVQQAYTEISDHIKSYIDGANVIIKELRKNKVTFRDAFEYDRATNYGRPANYLTPIAIKPEVSNVTSNVVIEMYEDELYYAGNEYHEDLLRNWNSLFSLIESIEVLSMEMTDENLTEGVFDIKGDFRVVFNTMQLLTSRKVDTYARPNDSAIDYYLKSAIETFVYESRAKYINEIFMDGKIKYQPMSKVTSLLFKKQESDLRKF